MHILIANNKVHQMLSSQILPTLAAYGNIDVVQNGRAAVLAYRKTAATGFFYDLVVLDQHLTALDGFAATEMIRKYESEHRLSGKRSMVCLISDNNSCHQRRTVRYGQDERILLIRKPANPGILESLARSIAADGEMQGHEHYVPMLIEQPVLPEIWATTH